MVTRGSVPQSGTHVAAAADPVDRDGGGPVPPPEHVLRAFGAPATVPELLNSGARRAWRCENVVIKSVRDPVEASWLATTLESLHVAGVRLARPIRSSDGRWVVSGWSAQRFVAGSPAPRHDEILQYKEFNRDPHDAVSG